MCLIPPSCWMSWCSWWAPEKTSKYQWETEIVTPPQHPEVIQNAGKFPVLSVCSLKLPFAITHRAIGNKSWFVKVKHGPDGMICKNIRRMKIFLPYKLCVFHVSGSSVSTGQSPFLLFSSHFLFPHDRLLQLCFFSRLELKVQVESQLPNRHTAKYLFACLRCKKSWRTLCFHKRISA